MPNRTLLERRHALLGAEAPLFYDRPLHLVRGEGAWVYDSEGRRYLDAYNNVPHVGHCHPHVVEALLRQAGTLNVSTRYLDEQLLDYGERLTATFAAPLSRVHLCCSGTEANELALRIARTCTGNQGIIVTDYCYHGNSTLIASISTGYPGPEGINPAARTITVPDPYREGDGIDGVARAEQDVGAAIASLAEAGLKPAALIVDTVFATEALPRMPSGYMERAVALVREAGGLYVADEVQPGFGRTGVGMWGHQLYDVAPDMVTLGKPMGNGHPLAGVVTTPALLDAFCAQAMYFNTFGGNPVSSAVGLAVLDVIEREGLVAHAKAVGAHLLAGLGALGQKHPALGDARGHGLFIAVELVEDRASKAPAPALAKAAANGMREHGVLVGRTGRQDHALKIRPPMPFDNANADELLAVLDEVLTRLGAG